MTATPTNDPADDNRPQALIGLAPLMRQAFAGVDLRPFGTRLVQRALQYPRDANTLMDLSTVLQLVGNRDLALATQAQALQLQQLYRLPAASGAPGIRLLAIVSAGDLMANTPIEFLIEGSDVALDLLYIDAKFPLPATLPEHDIVFIALGESDENRPLLTQIAQQAKSWTRPLLNRPECIANLTRNGACALLGSAPGISMPISVRVARATLTQLAQRELNATAILADGDFPIIVRPVGSHGGHGLDKIDQPDSLEKYLESEDAAEFYISRFVDYRSDDGQFRKYRIMLIEGKPFICHMAISQNWMIHYLNAGMLESAEKRAEEARFMADFETGFALRHAAAFRAVTEILQLDYVGLDCAETRDGKLLIFEADSDMIVHAMDPVDMFPYKQATMRKIFDAFHAMLESAIKRNRKYQ
ncbi:MAG: RimK family alpha-L-glutamate ligase [Burkholderiaceae bacterium]|nr:RimK family alpha-L-glutamate ligase [Burkholderiaceae bacterium]